MTQRALPAQVFFRVLRYYWRLNVLGELTCKGMVGTVCSLGQVRRITLSLSGSINVYPLIWRSLPRTYLSLDSNLLLEKMNPIAILHGLYSLDLIKFAEHSWSWRRQGMQLWSRPTRHLREIFGALWGKVLSFDNLSQQKLSGESLENYFLKPGGMVCKPF